MRQTGTALLVILMVGAARAAPAQLPIDALQPALGFGVDSSTADEREILTLFRRYLAEPSDSLRASCWSTAERGDGRHYDLLAQFVYQGFTHFTVVQLRQASGLPQTYLLRVLVSAVDDSTGAVRPLALYHLYAIREADRWVLANALPRDTRDWTRRTFGQVTFVYAPGHRFHPDRARATAAFADSLARAFGHPRPAPITYYFSDDLAETLRAIGLEFFPLGRDTVAGMSNRFARQVYVGSSADGEGYRHELAHIVLGPDVTEQTAGLVMEGLMTWSGGSAGLEYRDLLPGLARYLSAHPELTLQRLLEDPPERTGSLDVGYDGLAVLCKLVFDRGGLSALRILLSAGRSPADVVAGAAQALGVPATAVDSLWRSETGAR